MPIGNNQTAIMAFTVPLGKKIAIDRWFISMARSGWNIWSARITVRKRPVWWVFNAIRDITITNSSAYTFENNGYMIFTEKEDIKVTVEDVSDNWTIVSSEADWMTIDII